MVHIILTEHLQNKATNIKQYGTVSIIISHSFFYYLVYWILKPPLSEWSSTQESAVLYEAALYFMSLAFPLTSLKVM